jgi:SM-20-related protein
MRPGSPLPRAARSLNVMSLVAACQMGLLSIFEKFGLFLRPGFLGPDVCGSFRAAMRNNDGEAAEVFVPTGSAVDTDTRRARSIRVQPHAVRDMAIRLEAIRGDLEAHFDCRLGSCEEPDFLLYRPGGFYRPHRDRPLFNDDAAREASGRAVSVVLFLNDRSTEPNGFDGGALTFYGLVNDERWRDVGFPLQPQAGLLVAFRSDVLHEVAPIERGSRLTIVTWFPRQAVRR